MVRCEGRPGVACPENRNDSTVKPSQGEMMLCSACEIFRFPYLSKSKPASLLSSTSDTVQSHVSRPKSKPASNSDTVQSDDSRPKSKPALSLSSNSSDTVQSDDSTPVYKATATMCSKLVPNELLYFVNGTYGNRPEALIRTTILDFYREDEIVTARQLLLRAVDELSNLEIHNYPKNRTGSNKLKASVDDIIHIFQLIDERCLQDELPVFCAVNKSRVPLLADEMSALASIRLELCQLRQHVEELSSRLSSKCSCSRYATNFPELVPTGMSITVEQNDRCSDHTANNTTQYATVTPRIMENDGNISTEVCQPGLSAQSNTAVTQCSDNTKPTNYVETLKANMNAFEVVNRKNGRRKNNHNKPPVKSVVGDSKTGVPFDGVEKKSVICINRLQRNTSVEQITTFLQSKDISVLSCHAYSDKFDRYTFMRVCLPQSQVHKVYIASMWPLGVVVRPWVFRPGAKSTNDMGSPADQ